MAVGFLVCYVVMIGIYYGNGWGAKSLPFMSTRLLLENGTRYPIAEVFEGGVLNEERLLDFGLPRLTGTFAYALFMANAAVSQILVRSVISSNCLIDWRPSSSLYPLLG